MSDEIEENAAQSTQIDEKALEIAENTEVAEVEAEKTAENASEAAKQAEEHEKSRLEKRRERTREHISRLTAERNALSEEVARLHASQRDVVPQALEPNPTDADYYEKLTDWKIEQRIRAERDKMEQERAAVQQQSVLNDYNRKVAEFAQDHDDFAEVVGSLPQDLLTADVYAAIIGHPRGPEIAYHIANNEDDAFLLASVNPHAAKVAVDRIAKRLAAPQKPTNPISRTPEPLATVGGRAPVEVPDEKLTADQWYERRRAKLRG